jgi:2,4-dienoyl-CoA reductase-like NADH-dependent reductase (Old Yellow Enzyme family)
MAETTRTRCGVSDDRAVPEVDLLCPLTIRGVTIRNRIVVSPMCQYVAKDGFADDWHLVHLGSRAVGGAGLILVEATAVTPQGRITPGDLGIWDDAHIEPLARIVRFLERMGAVPGIQLAHAGRKASCDQPWRGGARLKTAAEGGWPVVAPSAIPFHAGDPAPIALDRVGLEAIVAAFAAGVKRALAAGFKVIEIHGAHGYLLHEFLSPLANQRDDEFGGSLANRMKPILNVARTARGLMPGELPLFVRISATDWVPGGWDLPQSIELSKELGKLGVDLIDCSSGGMAPKASIPIGKGYQVPFAAAIRNTTGLMTGAVGLITEAEQANEIVTSGSADLVLLAREMLREPYWALHAQETLDQQPSWPISYGYVVRKTGPRP